MDHHSSPDNHEADGDPPHDLRLHQAVGRVNRLTGLDLLVHVRLHHLQTHTYTHTCTHTNTHAVSMIDTYGTCYAWCKHTYLTQYTSHPHAHTQHTHAAHTHAAHTHGHTHTATVILSTISGLPLVRATRCSRLTASLVLRFRTSQRADS